MVIKKFCTGCGSEIGKDSVFCNSCGEKVDYIADEKKTDNAPPTPESGSNRSLFQGLAGHATSSNVQEAQETYGEMLVTGEQVLAAYKWIRDEVVFTSHRIIYQDVQGLTGKKKSFLSIPYESIHKFSKESAGWMDLDAELRIWVRGDAEAIKWEFRKDEAVNILFSILSEKVLNKV